MDKIAAEPQPDREQLAQVLERIAAYSSDDDIRPDLAKVVTALRGNGLIFINGPQMQV